MRKKVKKILNTKLKYFSFIFALLLLVLSLQRVYAASDATLYLNPGATTVANGASFTVDVMVNPGSTGQVNNVDLYLAYDQTKLSLDSISSTNFPIVVSSTIPSPQDGTASFSAGTSYGSNVTSISTYATLHFHALATTTSTPITIVTGTNKSGVYSDTVPGTNLLGSATSGTVTVNGVTTTTYNISGTVNGLSGSVTIQDSLNTGLVSTTTTTNGTNTFFGGLNDGEAYSISVITQPIGQTCTVTNGSGTISGTDVTNVAINCVNNVSGGSTNDVTPPVRSQGLPTGILAVGTTSATMSLVTDEAATCKYATAQGVSFASMSNTFSTTGGTTHMNNLTGLANGSDYHFYIKCSDVSNNANTDDFLISFSIANPQIVSSSSNSDNSSKKDSNPTPRYIHNSKSTITRGAILVQSGKHFSKSAIVLLYFAKPGGGYYAPTKITTTKSGTFSTSYKVNKPAGKYGWYALDTKNNRKSKIVYYKVK